MVMTISLLDSLDIFISSPTTPALANILDSGYPTPPPYPGCGGFKSPMEKTQNCQISLGLTVV